MLMTVKGFQLPDFVRLIGGLSLIGDDFNSLDRVDAYGNPWYAYLEIYTTQADIERNNLLIEKKTCAWIRTSRRLVAPSIAPASSLTSTTPPRSSVLA